MVICNLDALLRERHLKISKVAADTRISRTTLTALCNNAGKGIQFDTANTLCIYLGIGMEQLFTTLPYDITVEKSTVYSSDDPYNGWDSEIQVKYFDRKRTEFPILDAHIEAISYEINQYGETDDYYEIFVDLPKNNYQEDGEHGNSEEENELLKSVFGSMPTVALQVVKDRIGREMTRNCSSKLFYVKFSDELTTKG
ncbi:helix-turn-helix domain-containing protein [Butyricicoccus sp.]|uniref:helix-turn-helix domain-containing protein n=1 Tax=Butyricicoccus sp. TaxID=2049021 RepID=UPI003F14DDE8